MKDADLIIALFDASSENKEIFSKIIKDCENNVIYVANKCDMIAKEQCSNLKSSGIITVSAKYNLGIDNLLSVVLEKISNNFNSSSGLITRHRYRESLENALDYLKEFNLDKEIELSAEDIRMAVREIGKITGKVDVEEILDKIFGSFCIGK